MQATFRVINYDCPEGSSCFAIYFPAMEYRIKISPGEKDLPVGRQGIPRTCIPLCTLRLLRESIFKLLNKYFIFAF